MWERWRQPDGPQLETFAIIVGPANDQVRPYHDRMSVILDPSQLNAWLEPDAPRSALEALLQPYAGKLSIQPVSRAVNSPRNDGLGLRAAMR